MPRWRVRKLGWYSLLASLLCLVVAARFYDLSTETILGQGPLFTILIIAGNSGFFAWIGFGIYLSLAGPRRTLDSVWDVLAFYCWLPFYGYLTYRRSDDYEQIKIDR